MNEKALKLISIITKIAKDYARMEAVARQATTEVIYHTQHRGHIDRAIKDANDLNSQLETEMKTQGDIIKTLEYEVYTLKRKISTLEGGKEEND